jgi:4-hydroxythreonine-4-phosphate dehydrogenase
MKVYISQGHEKGIGLEVFFKTCLFLSQNKLRQLQLLAFKESVIETLTSLKLPFEINQEAIILSRKVISVTWLADIEQSQSYTSLKAAIALAEQGGVLFTLPTSKDQLAGFAGHTEYFRHRYKNPSLGMFFSGADMQLLLISDHVSLKRLPDFLSQKHIESTLLTARESLLRWGWKPGKMLISGINPHVGENGVIGDEDSRVIMAVKHLQDEYHFDIIGPFSGDTMLSERRSSHDILVYLFHDQGLGIFKGLNGFIGSNITLGLPFPRLSPDHGTSFSLFGKNEADYRGCRFSLRQALELLARTTDGQNTGHQGKGS